MEYGFKNKKGAALRKPDFPQQIKNVPQEAVGEVAQEAIKESVESVESALKRRPGKAGDDHDC